MAPPHALHSSGEGGYPPFRGTRLALADAVRRGGGWVAGRLWARGIAPRLCDASAEIVLAGIDIDPTIEAAWVSGVLRSDPGMGWRLSDTTVHAPARGESPDPDMPQRLRFLRRRANVFTAARSYFREQSFLELETPARVVCPGLEPHLSAFPSGDDRWLITSPELHLKRALAGGAGRIVEFARAFRDDERGPWHRPEFTMLEWYRDFAGLEAIEEDCEKLVSACAIAPGVNIADALPACDLTPPFERLTVREALLRYTGLDLASLQQRDLLAAALQRRGTEAPEDDSWDDLFFRVWVSDVEPRLGLARPVFVRDYPASQAALARVRAETWGDVAERFELYINGVELANAFHELNDPDEQRRRHEADRAARRATGAPVYPLDEAFLAALESGMPPAAGIALGFDRLVAVLLGATSLDEVTAFPGA